MKTLLTVLLLCLATLLPAQMDNPFGGIRHSSRDISGNIHLRWDDLSGGQGNLECYHNVGTAGWTQATPTPIGPGVMEALAPYTFGEKMRYRMRFNMEYMNESISFLHAAFWDNESFPPALNRLAYLSTDAAGDSVNVYNPTLDLRETYMAKSPTKLYFSMKTLSGTYPIYSPPTNFNIYMGMILNPEAVNDTIAYAMIYSFSIPGVVSSGLYKVSFDANTGTPVFQQLGGVQTQVSGGTLHLACDFAALTADPDFGPWPNASNSLIMMGNTIGVTLVGMEPVIGIGDYSSPAIVLFEDNYYQVAANTTPTWTFGSYNPTTRTLMMDYFDQQADFPLYAEVETPLGTIVNATPLSQDYSQIVSFVAQLPNETFSYVDWQISDNGIDFVNGTVNFVANEDETLVPVPISCRMANPVRAFPVQLEFKGLDTKPLQVQLYNLKGQKLGEIYSGIPTGDAQFMNWDGSVKGQKLPSGIYFLSINQDGRRLNQKFVLCK